MFSRFISLIGENNFKKIQNTNIIIIGLGGVGGYVLESLIRSGITNIYLIDNDKIELSNLNRQLLTNKNNIGKYKVDEAKNRALTINNSANITCYNMFLDINNINILNNIKIDYIIDCCDTINTKFELIKYSIKKHIKLITCLGTAKKLHPELLKITTLDKTSYDPIAKILRKKVRDAKINNKIIVLSSEEKIIKGENNILGSTSFTPGVAGLLITSYIINDIVKK